MKILTIVFFFFSVGAFAQAPLLKQWDYRYGGTADDYITTIITTSDGGYMLGGYSHSDSSGDHSESNWGWNDYWIVKLNSLGLKEWDKQFGGLEDDQLWSLQQTTDGGYILGGWSQSGISGDRTEDSRGSRDYWIIKTNSAGNKQWDKRFGGNSMDELYSVKQTKDGGYILGGYSYSDISGDKTENNRGHRDYWIVKTDPLGNKLWDKRYGGASDDELDAVLETPDGGYVLAGSSSSWVSGDKTDSLRGGADYWILKIDSVGNKLYDKCYGGDKIDRLNSIIETGDEGYYLAGYSLSDVSGEKTQPSQGSSDYWVVRADLAGTKLWDYRYGGSWSEPFFVNAIQTADRGFLLTGLSQSPISGDKTENNFQNQTGTTQAWAVKTDASGIKQWDKTIFTEGGDDALAFAVQAFHGCYVFAVNTDAGIGGYKTQPQWGGHADHDYWIVKFCDTSLNCNQSVSTSINGNTLTAFNGTFYQWYRNGNPVAGATSNVYIASDGGSYTVQVTDSNGCTAVSNPIIISGIDDFSEEDVVSIYPNPSHNNWQLSVGDNVIGSTLEVFDTEGRMVFQSTIANPQSAINFNAARGIYLLRISNAKQSVLRKLVRL